MKLSRNMTTEEVKRRFNDYFPKLKLEFYTCSHQQYEGSRDMDKITEEVLLSEISPDFKSGRLPFDEDMSVSDFETMMKERFGLHVQVFRKSGDQWMQTSITDHWTLNKQERRGEEVDKFLKQREE